MVFYEPFIYAVRRQFSFREVKANLLYPMDRCCED